MAGLISAANDSGMMLGFFADSPTPYTYIKTTQIPGTAQRDDVGAIT